MSDKVGVNPAATDSNLLGCKEYRKRNYLKAIVHITSAISVAPEYAEAYFNRGLCKCELGNFAAAILDFDSAKVLTPDVPDIYYYRGLAYENQNNAEKALLNFQESLSLLDGHSTELAIKLGNKFEELLRFNEAIRAYKTALRDPVVLSEASRLAMSRLKLMRAPGFSGIHKVDLSEYVDLSGPLQGFELLTIGVGPLQEVMCVGIKQDRAKSLPERYHFLEKLDPPLKYRIVKFSGTIIKTIDIEDACFPMAHIQPLPDDEILLVGSRCWYSKDLSVRNAHVYGPNGDLRREFCLGDGILDVQTTPSGLIWVVYFDEGVIGNMGWGDPGPTPVGKNGITCFDREGKMVAEPKLPVGYMWMESLNVVSDSELLCWTESHFLVHFREERAVFFGPGQCVTRGGRLLAASDNLILYSAAIGQENCYYLAKYTENTDFREHVNYYQFTDGSGAQLVPIQARGRLAYFRDEQNRIYRVDIETLQRE